MPIMTTQSGSASDFILTTLRQYADRELRAGEFYDLAEGRYQHENIKKALYILRIKGLVVRIKDGGDASWWAIAAAGLRG